MDQTSLTSEVPETAAPVADINDWLHDEVATFEGLVTAYTFGGGTGRERCATSRKRYGRFRA